MDPATSCQAVIVTGGTPAPHFAVSTNPRVDESIAPIEATTPQGSTGPPPGPSMITTPTMPTRAPTTAITRGRWPRSIHDSRIMKAADVAIRVAARLEGSRWQTM